MIPSHGCFLFTRRLAEACGTDKWGLHRYTTHYQTHLSHLRSRSFNLLEIGVGGHDAPDVGGASLRMWKAFFPKAHIHPIDIFDKSALQEPRVSIRRGSSADPAFLRSRVARIGRIDERDVDAPAAQCDVELGVGPTV